jgi:hypothetical protein
MGTGNKMLNITTHEGNANQTHHMTSSTPVRIATTGAATLPQPPIPRNSQQEFSCVVLPQRTKSSITGLAWVAEVCK